MSLFRLPKLRRIASHVGHFRDRFAGRASTRGVTERSYRRLALDPLEQRQLLSLSPMGPVDHLVNESFVGDVGSDYEVYDLDTLPGQSVAVDDDGDFVVTWTRYDYVLDPTTGNYVIDPISGAYMTDANVYARYYTDEVQRLDLPVELANDVVSGAYGNFSLIVGGNEVQKLTISSAPEPYWPEEMYDSIMGTFTMGFDVNGNGSIGAGERFTMIYDEWYMQANEDMMQAGLRGLGGALTDVVVDCVAPNEFYIYFGDQSHGLNQPEIEINPAFTNWTSGFYPAATMSTVREPVTISNIPVHPTDPFATARVIEQMFLYNLKDHYQAPTFFPTEEEVFLDADGNNVDDNHPEEHSFEGMDYLEPTRVRYTDYRVSVTPVLVLNSSTGQYEYSLTSFEVTYIDESGKTNLPEMVLIAAVDDAGVSHLDPTADYVSTIKEPSPEFRVNDPEPNDPFTPWPDKTHQYEAAVAMDADGDFVITWTSEVAGVVGNTDLSNIYARRFSPSSYVDDPQFVLTDGTKVHCVVPQGNAFLVNTYETGAQNQPAVGMDDDGNFVISWVSASQELSYFNHVSAQRYNRDGDRVGSEFIVVDNTDATDTDIHLDPYVSLSDEGYILFTWTQTRDPDYYRIDGYTGQFVGGFASWVNARLFDPNMDATAVWTISDFNTTNSGGGGASTSAFDSAGGFLISYDVAKDSDYIGVFSEGIYVIGYEIVEDADGNMLGVGVNRNEFRANSSSFLTGTRTLWSGDQWNGNIMVDADGDITATYEGFGADSSEDVWMISQPYYTALINADKNADLLAFFDPTYESLQGFEPEYAGSDWADNVDQAIEYYLIRAQNLGANSEQIGRLYAVLNTYAGMIRGESNGVFFSNYDASPGTSANELTGDSVLNAQRDGSDAVYIVEIDSRATGGNFQVSILNENTGTSVTATITPVYVNNVLQPNPTAAAIEAGIQAALGGNWSSWPVGGGYEGVVECRRIDNSMEWSSRDFTSWAWYQTDTFYYVYEVSFEGDLHDMEVQMARGESAMVIGDVPAAPPVVTAYNFGEMGEQQTYLSSDMQPDGDFVAAWSQWEEDTNGLVTSTNVYFREFNESTDPAGPNITDFLLDDGTRLTDGGQVIDTMNYIIVTFDERLDTTEGGTHSVTNLANWSLMKDGIKLAGGISDVVFGLNVSTTLGLNTIGSNKWEAVVFFDGNGSSAGVTDLAGGNYQIVASNAIRDVAGNPLGRTGYLPQGESVSRSFYLTPPTGTETLVNTAPQASGTQILLDTAGDPDLIPNSPRSIAGDADGDYVVVWTDETGAQPGVWAKLYRTTWTETAGQRVSTTTSLPAILVTPFALAGDHSEVGHASVARDGDGDFIVTWSQNDGTAANPDWNVYYQRFNALGGEVDSEPVLVNTETEGAQRYSSVAVDTEGDFVIVWQSEGQDGSGYGIYAQRFSRSAEPVGGANEIQLVQILGDITTATFTLNFDGQITAPITFNGNLVETATQVEQAFANLASPILVKVEVLNDTDLAVEFIGEHARRDVAPLVLNNASIAGSGQIKLSTDLQGISAELRVNDTTAGNQLFPSVAMDRDGEFVVTWTSFGQDGDAAHESNIYAKLFDSVLDPNDLGTVEVLINQTIDGDQKWSDVALDADGDFVITWTSYGQDNGGNGPGAGFLGENGIYARRFLQLPDNQIGATDEFQVNSFTEHNQQHSQVAMDADGDFTITWESFQDRPSSSGADSAGSYGVYAQRYIRTELLGGPLYGANGEIGEEIHVNSTITGDQRFPSIILDDTGDAIVAWTGNGPGDPSGVFLQRYYQMADDAGPIVTDVHYLNAPEGGTATLETVLDDVVIVNEVGQFVVTFGEDMNVDYGSQGAHSVLNPDLWQLVRNGVVMNDAIVSIEFGLNQAYNSLLADAPSGKYEAVITFDADAEAFNLQSLTNGDYVLTVTDEVWDIFDNPLDGDRDGHTGGDYHIAFTVLASGIETRVNTDPDGNQVFLDDASLDGAPNSPQSVADDADGDYGVVWIEEGRMTDEVQRIAFGGAWGMFGLSYNGLASGNIVYVGDGAATAASIQTQLDALGLDTIVTAIDDTTIEIAFTGTDANADHPQLVVEPGSANDISGDVDVETDREGGVSIVGVFVKLYDVEWYGSTDTERQSTLQVREPINPDTGSVWLNNEICVTDNPTATYASIAMDADGDFIITWSQDDNPSGAADWNVYARRYDAMGNPLGDAFLVNTVTKDDQRFSTVAIDHDGEFVIAWQSEGQDGNGYEIYAQTYDRFGNALGKIDELQVVTMPSNSTGTFKLVYKDASGVEHSTGDILYDGDIDATAQTIQTALDALGLETEVVARTSTGIDITFVGADGGQDHKQLLIDPGTITGVKIQTQQQGKKGEFRVNQNTEGDQVFASVAMDALGNFVMTWTSYDNTPNDGDPSDIYARQFVWVDNENRGDIEDTIVGGTEFLVNQNTTAGEQRWSDVAIDMQGDYVITWTSVEVIANVDEAVGIDGAQDVFARRFRFGATSGGAVPITQPVGDEFQVNTYATGTQQHSSVAMDAAGNFVIAWESFQDLPRPSGGQPNSLGVYAQAYVSNDQVGTVGGPNGELDVEYAVNGTKAGPQRMPGVALDDAGDVVIVWSGNGEVPGQEDNQGIFMRRQDRDDDTAGPTVTDVLYLEEPGGSPGTLEVMLYDALITYDVNKIVVDLGENLNTLYGDVGAHSIRNPNLWQLTKNGKVVEDAIVSVAFGLNQAYISGLADAPSGKYEAVLTFDGDAQTVGNQALDNGVYVLSISDEVRDLFGNPFDGNLDGVAGGNFSHRFTIRSQQGGDDLVSSEGHTDPETSDAVAVDADGDYVVAWTVYDAAAGADRVMVRVFDADGTPATGATPVTTSAAFAGDAQRYASVAIDADGDFIVTWSNYRDADGDASNGREAVDVYARRYRADGTPYAADAFLVNNTTDGVQKWSAVAMDTDGDFVIAWSSYGQENKGQVGFGYGIYARRYDSFGYAQGPEFQVNTTTAGNQQLPSVAMDSEGRFVIAWQSDQNGIGDDIVARAYQADGSPAISPLAGEFLVNDTLTGNQRYPDVAMNLAGDTFVITWSSSQKTDDPDGYGIYTKAFNFLTEVDLEVGFRYTGPTVDFSEGQMVDIPIVVTQQFVIDDLNIEFSINHEDPSDLWIALISPSGTAVILFQEVPREGDANGSTASGPNGQDFENTILDDEAEPGAQDAIDITDSDNAQAPFTGTFAPENPLALFDGETAQGTWILRIWDNDPDDDPDQDPIYDPAGNIISYGHVADGGRFFDWSLDFTRNPAVTNEILVNTTTQGNQIYSSVAMDHQGNSIVTWSGVGTQKDQEDTHEFGVFAQRFDLSLGKDGGETRLNATTEGMQWLPSVGMDGESNFVAVWSGDADNDKTALYAYVSVDDLERTDFDGPIVTDVFLANGERLLSDEVAMTGLDTLVVAFSEDLSIAEILVAGVRTPALESILNPSNWSLERGGSEIVGAIKEITFNRNPATRRYEAVVTFDGNGMSAGSPGLSAGNYVLSLSDQVEDALGNALNGDYDGQPGTDPAMTGYAGFQFAFGVADTDDRYIAEHRVNQTTDGVQFTSVANGTGYAREVTTMAVAVDHDGDYVVVWTSYEQDNPLDTDVFYRLYRYDSATDTWTPGDEHRANVITEGHQGNATVAMDADGDFIIVWESTSDDGTLDVYAQRFDAAGNRIENTHEQRNQEDPYYRRSGNVTIDGQSIAITDIEVLVNTSTAGEQFNPAAAIDSYGNYIIVWGTAGEDFSYFNNVMAQRFDFRGEAMGEEFQVNVSSMPGASGPSHLDSFLTNPSVAMNDDGLVAVTWDRATLQQNGVVTDTEVVLRVFDAGNNPLVDAEGAELGEVVVSTGEVVSPDNTHDTMAPQGGNDIARRARNPQVAMDTAGNFTVVYEAYQDHDYGESTSPDSYGIYYRRFDALGTPLGDAAQQANTVVTSQEDILLEEQATIYFDEDQVNPTIAMDADGDFVIFWNGNGAQPDPLDTTNMELVGDTDDAGVFGRWFHGVTATSEPTTTQQRANSTESGAQQFASVAMTPGGSTIVVWQGAGVGDRSGIFVRTYDSSSDTAGPMATELRVATGSHDLVGPGDNIRAATTDSVWVVFDENLVTGAGLHSVENVNNWALINGKGEELQGAVESVTFGYSATLNKWVATVNFSGANGLATGTYTLVARSAIYDLAGNPLARTGYQPYGTGRRYDELGNEIPLDPATSPTGGFGFQFTVETTWPGNPTLNSLDQLASAVPEIVYGEGDLGLVGYQDESDVARNTNGDYVVVWVEYREIVSTLGMTVPEDIELQVLPAEPVLEANIMVQRFNAAGREQGDPILVNTLTTGDQIDPAVAIDDNGNFVVVWSGVAEGLGDDVDEDSIGPQPSDIYAQRFDADGNILGGQFRVNQWTNSVQDEPSIAMSRTTGDYVITWSSFAQDGNMDGVYGRFFRANGLAYGNEFLVNVKTTAAQGDSEVALATNANGTYTVAVAWVCEGEASGTGIRARVFNFNPSTGTRTNVTSDILVNTYTNYNQLDPAIAMDADGDFAITWTSRQDGSGWGIYAQRFNAAGVKQGAEFRVNETTVHDQLRPDISMAANGDFVIVWDSYNQDTIPPKDFVRSLGVFARAFAANGSDYNHPAAGVVGEFRVNAQTDGDQFAPAVSMDSFGHYVVTWTGFHDELTTFVENTEGEAEEEFLEVPLTLTAIYSRFIDPPADDAGDAALADVVISGTSGNDVFEFLGGMSPELWIVKVNGVRQTIPSNVATLRFDGKAGMDTVILSGTSADDVVEFWTGRAAMTSYDYSVVVENVETITASGGGGDDMAVLHDSLGADTFVGKPDVSEMTGTGFTHRAENFETVRAHADSTGSDTAFLHDSAGDDTFTATPTSSKMTGGEYLIQADGFEYVKAYATGTGNDVANLYDSAQNDTLIATDAYAKIYNANGYYVLATDFGTVRAYATAGGKDVANMYGSDGDDTFTAASTYAKFRGDGFNNVANYFESVNASGMNGNDTATLYDSTGDDTFVAGPRFGQMFGAGYQIRADFFRWVYGFGNAGGNDLASLYDSAGNDTLYVTQNYAQLYGDAYFNRAYGFDRVDARATGGGYDEATMHDSALNDYLEAEGDWVRLSNEQIGFAYWAAAFDRVTAQSTSDGDTKRVAQEIDFVLAMEGIWTDE